jgi:hypothetical protein
MFASAVDDKSLQHLRFLKAKRFFCISEILTKKEKEWRYMHMFFALLHILLYICSFITDKITLHIVPCSCSFHLYFVKCVPYQRKKYETEVLFYILIRSPFYNCIL